MANIDKNFRVKNGLDVKGTINLAAIAESKSETALDVFVYDTGKDSDGGAWRKRTQGTSWYNETLNTATRGSRREFPAVAVIVIVGGGNPKVTIYDGDDPSLPLWRECAGGLPNYSGTVLSSIHLLNGKLFVGASAGYTGYLLLDFPSDYWSWNGPGQGANGNGKFVGAIANPLLTDPGVSPLDLQGTAYSAGVFTYPALVATTINDVAMTVLPDAPVNPVTGLPVPTIAVATAGGVSVIKDDGTVVNPPPYVAKHSRSIDIGKNGDLFNDGVFATTWSDSYTPYDDGNWSSGQLFSYESNYPTTRFGSSTNQSNIIVTPYGFAGEGMIPDNTSPILYQMMLDPSDVRDGSAIAYTTSTYNTGWMNGDIKGAFLSDTDDTDLVGSGELVTNGDDFTGVDGTSTLPNDASNVGWYETSNGTYSVTGGVITITNGTNGRTGFYWTISVVEGATYRAEWVGQTGGVQTRITDTINPNDTTPLRIFNLGSTGSRDFVATSSTLYVSVTNYDAGSTTGSLDKISVKLADEDRSVNNNGLIVNGTVTRSAVATGADLVAYSGFSSSNYLEQPYNSDLDFGTGDFCIMGWIKTTVTTQCIFEKGVGGSTGFSFELYLDGFLAKTGNSYVIPNTDLNIVSGVWRHVAMVRRSGVLSFVLDAVETFSVSNSKDISAVDEASRIGCRTDGSRPAGSLALLRISATAPTADQITKIYEDEKVLFQENAQATLYGTSNVVTALDHDEDTGLLHVGTSAGRSVFQGLRRVDNTTDAVGTAISVVDGLVVEE